MKKSLKSLLVQISIKTTILKLFIKIISRFFIPFLNSIFVKADYFSINCNLKQSFMDSFGSRLRECRKQKGLSQNELANILKTNHSVIGKYERDDVKPSIDAVKRIAEVLETTIAYLLGETETDELFRDPAMLKRLKEINALPEKDRECILYNLDAVLRDVKTRQAYS
jgi:transcriptional regulator with XRE-family HTH domain